MYQTEPTADLLTEEFLPVYGSFGQRFLAAIIDGVILLIPLVILKYAMPGIMQSFVGIIIQWLYYALQESGTNQATFGKKAMGLKVTNLQGDRISFGQASGRFFGKIISGLIILIGYLMMLWDDKKQTLHDKIAGTLVIKT